MGIATGFAVAGGIVLGAALFLSAPITVPLLAGAIVTGAFAGAVVGFAQGGESAGQSISDGFAGAAGGAEFGAFAAPLAGYAASRFAGGGRGSGGSSCPSPQTSAPASNAGGYGDLSPKEIEDIQVATNRAGRPIHVGGSAASGNRRFPGSDLPIGKGPNTKSDIDYIIPHSSKEWWLPHVNDLPGLDPSLGPIFGVPNPHQGPFISFEPK